MESVPAVFSGLTPFVTSNVTNGWFQGFPNDEQMTKLHYAILSLVGLFACSVSISILKSSANKKAGVRCFQGLITLFSAMSVAMLSASILPAYFKWLSYFFCSIPVFIHSISDKRWFRDWFPKPPPILPICHRSLFSAWTRWFPCISMNGVASDQEPSHAGETEITIMIPKDEEEKRIKRRKRVGKKTRNRK